jgi:hypothetical protein
MAKEIVIDKIPEEFTYKKLGESCSGECYETKDGRVFKKYKFPITYYQSLKNIADYYKCNHLVLPEEFYFLKNMKEENFIGYIRALVTGTTFAHLEDNVEMVKFINALEFLEREMVANSRRSLLYVDMNQDNLFLTPNNEIKVIDQDLYEIIGYHPYIRPVPDSMKDLASTIIHIFFSGREFTDKRICDNIRKCGAHIGGILRPSQLLSETSEILEQDCGSSIRTLGDFRKNLELAREK